MGTSCGGSLRYVPRDYSQAVAADVTAKAPWPPEEKQLVLQRQIRIGFTEEQVRVAWGNPESERRTVYEFGEIKYLHYRGKTVVHLKNGRVQIISQ